MIGWWRRLFGPNGHLPACVGGVWGWPRCSPTGCGECSPFSLLAQLRSLFLWRVRLSKAWIGSTDAPPFRIEMAIGVKASWEDHFFFQVGGGYNKAEDGCLENQRPPPRDSSQACYVSDDVFHVFVQFDISWFVNMLLNCVTFVPYVQLLNAKRATC